MLGLVVASISLAVGKTVEVNTETRRQSRRADRCPSSTPHGFQELYDVVPYTDLSVYMRMF